MYFDPHPSLNGHNGPSKTTLTPPRPHRRSSVFLNELAVSSWRSFLHHLTVAQFVGLPLLRLITMLWVIVMVLGFLDAFPGGRWISPVLLLALIAFYAHFYLQRRADFIRFQVSKSDTPCPAVLPIEDKIAIYVTGECAVEGKHRRFTCLPGFYRTFATREHALLCQVKKRRIFGIASWNSAEVGLWYVFFYPSTIRNIRTGQLSYGRTSLPTIAVDYLVTRTFTKTGEPDRTELQTVFISTPEAIDVQEILADLLVDAPLENHPLKSHPVTNG
ncbi:MAG: hypothetical protein U0175_35970 [Caldilineaceae bacterium]